MAASFAKHLSTHLYFHMERANRKQSDSHSSTSGFHQSDHFTAIGGSDSSRSWNKENDRLKSVEQLPSSYGCELSCNYSSGGSGSPRHSITDHRERIMGRDWPEDYFSYSPYLLTPDLSSKSRNRRRACSVTATSKRYEFCAEDDDEDDDECGQLLMEHPRLRPPEPTSPIMDRRFFPLSPQSYREGTDDLSSPSAYQGEFEDDCFIVPTNMRGRFLPLGKDKGMLSSQGMNAYESSDSKVCIIIDFRENGSFASQDLPFPSTALRLTPKEWLASQLNRQKKAFKWVRNSQAAIEGLLLMNVERHSQFPFVMYLVTNTIHTDPRRLIMQLRSQVVVSQGSEQLQHTAGYEEVATITKPTLELYSKRPVTDTTGYIISAFRVFPGEDREKLERNWLIWTGARQVYKCLPKHLGLRRLTFHKKIFPDGGITYVLMCECEALVQHVTEALVFVDHLRARCCGYTALYRPVEMF